ncbi:hypothetical protein ACLXNF_16715 [Mycobacteroides chelonae]|uniref:hypothetical protein n=1 Tax=Mycobacteroides chelonae TaxID=1774 RepID=UPI0039EB46A6
MSAMFEVEMRFFSRDGSSDPIRFEEFLDVVVDEFAKQGLDVDYTAVASELEASFTIEVAQDDPEDGLIAALTTLRAVLTAVGVESEGLGGHEVVSTRKLAMA